jgi:hypothetical protein
MDYSQWNTLQLSGTDSDEEDGVNLTQRHDAILPRHLRQQNASPPSRPELLQQKVSPLPTEDEPNLNPDFPRISRPPEPAVLNSDVAPPLSELPRAGGQLRFEVGSKVLCAMDESTHAPGTVVAKWYREPGIVAAYQVELDAQEPSAAGRMIFAECDDDHWISLDPESARLRLTKSCAACGCGRSPSIKLKECAKCRSVRYCNSECQKIAWKVHGHKKSCGQPLPSYDALLTSEPETRRKVHGSVSSPSIAL